MTIIKDDRTNEQKVTHTLAVVGTDATNSRSYVAWAFKDGQAAQTLGKVQGRSDFLRGRIGTLDGYRPTGAAHLHIYVAKD